MIRLNNVKSGVKRHSVSKSRSLNAFRNKYSFKIVIVMHLEKNESSRNDCHNCSERISQSLRNEPATPWFSKGSLLKVLAPPGWLSGERVGLMTWWL